MRTLVIAGLIVGAVAVFAPDRGHDKIGATTYANLDET